MLSWRGIAVLGFLSTLIVFVGGVSLARRRPMPKVHVEIDIYSGRENPNWDLSQAEAEEFDARLLALRAANADSRSVPDGLGYRGLRVDVNSERGHQRLVCFGGLVMIEAPHAADRRNLVDPDRALEEWLLHTGEKHVGADLFRGLLG